MEFQREQLFFFIMAQSIPSVPIRPPPLPPPPQGICHFVLETLQMPHGGAQKYSANSPSWDNTKIVFSSK